MELWWEIKRIIDDGRTPVVHISYANWVEPQRRKRGNPKKRDATRQWIHRFTGVPINEGKRRPMCLRVGCGVRLRNTQWYVCSEACRIEAIAYYEERLAALYGQELPWVKNIEGMPDVRSYTTIPRQPTSTELFSEAEKYTNQETKDVNYRPKYTAQRNKVSIGG